jgi:hypothetical protein
VLHYLIEWSADCNADGIVDYGQILRGELPDYNGNNIPDCCESGDPCVTGNYPVQWRVDDGGNGHWYAVVIPTGDQINWEASRAAAIESGGHLATSTSAPENEFILQVAKNLDAWWVVTEFPQYCIGPWLGGYQPPNAVEPGNDWNWVTGEGWAWTNWWLNEPNDGCGGEDHLHFLTQGSTIPSGWWNDGGGSPSCGLAPRSYVIEWSADCNADGIVDYGQILRGELADINSNGVPDCCDQGIACNGCIGDLDDTGEVDAADIGILLLRFGRPGVGDLDGDGIVTAGDISVLLLNYGPCSGFTAGLPTVEEVPPLLAPLMPELRSPVTPQRR